MIKYLAFAALVSLCACSPAKPAAAPVVVTVELPESGKMQAVACSDDFDCLKRMTGLCPNGYEGGARLKGANDSRVAIMFHCITNEEVQAKAEEEAEEKAAEEAYKQRLAERLRQMQEAQKKQQKK